MGGSTLVVPRTSRVVDLNIASHGDSISRDLGLSNYVYQLRSLILAETGDYASIAQRGINGISYNYRWPFEPQNVTMITDAPTSVDPTQADGIDDWLLVFAGTNGIAINGNSAATEYADFKTYITARISAGWTADNIVVATMLPRTGVTDSIRQDFNTALVGDDGGYGYRLARLDLNANIGDAGDDANATYFYDGTHPTAAGHAIIAQIFYDAMFP